MFKITITTFDLDETRTMIDGLANECTFTLTHVTDGWEGGSFDVDVYADNMFSIRRVTEEFDLDIDDTESVAVDEDGIPVGVEITPAARLEIRNAATRDHDA